LFLGPNHFEVAFEQWLRDNRIQYVRVDQHKRAAFARSDVKSFDFLVYPRTAAKTLIVEVKGRRFAGKSLAGLKGLPNWTTMEDVRGLLRWEDVLGSGHKAHFAFIYEMINIDIELDGRSVFEHDGRRYFGLLTSVEDYQQRMRQRSVKWQTVMLGAEDFRQKSQPLERICF
jgi:hypothetical protein